MLEKIMEILRKHPKISDWTVSEVQNESAEFFFVRDKLDMNRRTKTTELDLRVFVEFAENGEAYKGDAVAHIGPSHTEEEIRRKIDEAVQSASYVKNKTYELSVPEPADSKALDFSAQARDTIGELCGHADEFMDLVFRDRGGRAKINSLEVFAVNGLTHFLCSNGVEASYPSGYLMLEPVTDAIGLHEPVEIFNDLKLKGYEPEKIRSLIERQLEQTEGRALAEAARRKKNTRVILSGTAVEDLLFIALQQATDRMVYRGQSRAKIGERLFSAKAPQSLNIRMNPQLESSVYARPVDAEGKILRPYTLYEDGVVKNLRTQTRFSSYLGIPHIGYISTFECEGGDKPLASYKTGDYTEIKTFSDFLTNPENGDFGGEFRLAEQVENGKKTYISGGTLSENLFDCQARMVFSAECEARDYSLAPAAIIFDGVDLK